MSRQIPVALKFFITQPALGQVNADNDYYRGDSQRQPVTLSAAGEKQVSPA
jgi:hypothetical protein